MEILNLTSLLGLERKFGLVKQLHSRYVRPKCFRALKGLERKKIKVYWV